MKTTVELPDALLAAARKLAIRRGTTLRALVEEGLRQVIQHRGAKRFKLRDGSWSTGGLRREFRGASWEQIRNASYGWRG